MLHRLRAFGFGLVLTVAASAAQAQMYTVNMNGASEVDPNASPGQGMGTVTVNVAAMTMAINVAFDSLIGNTTAAHIHAPTANPLTGGAGVATQTPSFSGFPLGVTSGTFVNTFDMSLAGSYNSTFITNNGGTAASAWTALTNAMAQGRSYFNIHTAQFPGGEIRGFLVPEPGTMIALGGLFGAAVLRRTRRSRRPQKP